MGLYLFVAILAGLVALTTLNALASRLTRDLAVYNLTVQARQLRKKYRERLERLRRGETDVMDI